MNELIKLVSEYKESKFDFVFECIVVKVKHIITSKTRKVSNYYRDDFSQELLECLINVIDRFKMKNYIISKNLFKEDNLKELKEHKFKNINVIFNNSYISYFIEKYGKDLFILAFENKDKLSLFIDEYELFCNENQFIKYLNISFNRLVHLFYKKINKNQSFNCVSLNIEISDEVELIDLISDTNEDEKSMFYDESLLSKKDLNFLSFFYEDGKSLTGKEVAKKLNITQQAVSIRLKRIKLRYNKAFDNKYKKW